MGVVVHDEDCRSRDRLTDIGGQAGRSCSSKQHVSQWRERALRAQVRGRRSLRCVDATASVCWGNHTPHPGTQANTGRPACGRPVPRQAVLVRALPGSRKPAAIGHRRPASPSRAPHRTPGWYSSGVKVMRGEADTLLPTGRSGA